MRRRLSASFGAILALSSSALGNDGPVRLEVFPPSVRLDGLSASLRPVVLGVFSDGATRDLSEQVRFEPSSPVVTIEEGRIRPSADGTAEIRVVVGSAAASVPVEVAGSAKTPEVSFRNDVEPALTKLGCNQGACHGGQHGKGGFRLSLLGFEAEPDYTSIVKSAEGRRASPAAPEESLLLLKPTLAVAHGGGRKMEAGGREYQIIRRWLEQGAQPPAKEDATITGLAVYPDRRILEVGETQRLLALATFSDGSTRDVTDDARFDTLNEAVTQVDKAGRARSTGQGETSIMVRYQGHAAMARMTIPYARGKEFAWSPRNVIDEKAAAKWRELGLAPSPPCTDAEFLRRAMLDAIGTTPTPDEVDDFLADGDPEKRDKLVDRLLERPEYVDFWVLKWGDLLRVNSDKLGPQGMLAFNLWLRESFRGNKSVNRMVDELVTAQGSIYTNGPANYFRVASDPADLAETTAQVFMGVRLQCARCHHHPFEAYGQDDYYGLAAYFARVRAKNSEEFGLAGREQVIFVSKAGDVRHPRTGKVMTPTPLAAKPADDGVDRRRALSRWLTGPDNPWLARNVVNRYWGYLLGRGLVHPIDDLRETNPPSNPELLDALASGFVKGGYDLKKLLRLILTSRVYGLSALPTPDNRLDTLHATHYPLKRLSAEQLLDAVNAATGTAEKFPLRPLGTRAIALPDTNTPSYFLDTFGRPVRAIACECERTGDPTLGQALHLMNGDAINRKLSQRDGRLARMLKDPRLTDETLIQSLYRLAFARPPSDTEVANARRVIADAPDRQAGAQDLLWGLLNSKEFLFNH